MQTITLNIKTPNAYIQLLELLKRFKDIEICETQVVNEDTTEYQVNSASEQRRARILAMRGAWQSTSIAETERQIQEMRDEWE